MGDRACPIEGTCDKRFWEIKILSFRDVSNDMSLVWRQASCEQIDRAQSLEYFVPQMWDGTVGPLKGDQYGI